MQVVKAPSQGWLPKGTKKVTGLRFQCNPVSFLVLTCLALSEDQCTQGQSPRSRRWCQWSLVGLRKFFVRDQFSWSCVKCFVNALKVHA